jgi:hypothetical protein
MEIFQKSVYLMNHYIFQLKPKFKYVLGLTKQNVSKYFEISQEIWDKVSPVAGSQEKNAALLVQVMHKSCTSLIQISYKSRISLLQDSKKSLTCL